MVWKISAIDVKPCLTTATNHGIIKFHARFSGFVQSGEMDYKGNKDIYTVTEREVQNKNMYLNRAGCTCLLEKESKVF